MAKKRTLTKVTKRVTKIAPRRASTVSSVKLSAVVERAARQVATKKKLQFEPSLRGRPGIIYGRYIRSKISLNDAQAVAKDITTQVSRSSRSVGFPSGVTPAVMAIDKRIIVGFIEPSQMEILMDR